MNIIGINGVKRSGKGETGKAIEALLPGVRQLGFADKLKVFAAKSLGYTALTDAECVEIMDEAKEEWYSTWRRVGKDNLGVFEWSARQLLQHMGTEARTVFGDDFWVDQVLPEPTPGYEYADLELGYKYPDVTTLVFTDLRFPNEAQRVIDLGGFNIEVLRPGAESDGHASELKLPADLIKYQINNDSSLANLGWEVEKVLELEGLA